MKRGAGFVAGGSLTMMNKGFLRAALGLVGSGLLVSAAPPAPVVARAVMTVDSLAATEWRNPKDSVHIRATKCGANLCGNISWASPKAIADARRGGENNLVGTRIFRDFRRDAKGTFHGKVYVPDLQQTFQGTLSFTDENTMVGKGCVVLGLICKSQTWTRIR
jgi:uncharacterized protein (DUF2147 family)